MKLWRSSLFRRVTGLLGLGLWPLIVAQAQQTITATAGQVGVAYSYQVSSNATPPVQYGAAGLPAGLAINASSGLITGTPTTPGTVVATVAVTSSGQTNNAAISITIAAVSGTPVITSATTASGSAGAEFTYNTAASNTPTSYNISGLPSGLTANTTTGVISGTPTAAGTSSISLSANNAGGTGATVTLALSVGAAATAPVITSETTAAVAVSASLSYTITATNTPTSFAATGLPLGVSADTATGAITGVPTVAGVYTVRLSATNAGGTSAIVNLTLTVGALSSITSSATSSAAAGVAYTYTATASPAASSFNLSGLPAGLTANTTTGVISGTPTAAGISSVSLSANNATGTGSTTVLTLTVGNLSAITSATSASGTVGTAFSYTITANNTPTSFAVTGLPAGLLVNSTSGLISGTPTAAGSSSVSLSATNAFGAGNATTLTISIPSVPSDGGGSGGGSLTTTPVITTQPTDQTANANAIFTVTATGSGSLGFQWQKNGVAISGANNYSLVLTGVTAASMGSYSVVVSNAGGSVTSSAANLTVNGPPAITAQPSGQTLNAGASASFSVTALGSATLAYQWWKDGFPVTGGTGATLALANVTASLAGNYTAVVTNSFGSVTSSTATLAVIDLVVKPVITVQPRSQTTAINSSVTLSVSAASASTLSYQWQLNGVAISGATSSVLNLSNVAAAAAGSYAVVVTNSAGSTTSSVALLSVTARPVPGSYFGSFGNNGGTFALFVNSDRTGVFLGYARGANIALVSRDVVVDGNGHFNVTTSSAAPTSAAALVGTAAAATVYVIDGTIAADGTLSGTVLGLNLALSAPAPASTGVTSALAGFYQAGASGSAATSYTIIGVAGDAYVVTVSGTSADAGKGTVSAAGVVAVTTENQATIAGTIQAARISVTDTPLGGTAVSFVGANNAARTDTEKLINLSTRSQMGTGGNVLISGFAITGTQPKSVLVRGVGPSLAQFGLQGAMSAARLEIFQGATSIAVGNDWGTDTNASAITAAAALAGAFPLAAGSHDAALLLTLNPGNYTAILSGQNNATGVALVEAYDATVGPIPTAQRMINMSGRGVVSAGDGTLVGGFYISGTVPKRVLLRGAGPSLAQFGLTGVLAKPQLQLFKGNQVIAQNAGWGTSPDAAAIAATGVQVGAFAFTAGSADSALIVNLDPGTYTVQVNGVGGTTGIALVEIYDVP